ncbi:hypothetical protein [Rhizobium phaseoli]|uniref:hypothetical protein n=1 Tax=Rhizobium phaseoli TaxID=396 RepID=UPI000BE8C692|nr:hypothetical protein [Rhizobium phaseoli]PDS31320.1 hypothetical protein CO650_11065 [Rhizobium phaseoli]
MGDALTNSQRERIIDQKSEVTGRISDTCRVIGFGLLVFYFTVHFNDSAAAARLKTGNNWSLFIIGALGVLTIFMDYLQYLFGSRAAHAALKNENHLYNDKSLAYRARNFFFSGKQATAGLGSLVLIYVMGVSAGLGPS